MHRATATVWETGSRAQRLGYLRRLRRADPAAARELLDRDWATLTPDERGDLVAALADGLALADEALLERALDDRRKEVREAAAGLLVATAGVGLPGPDGRPGAGRCVHRRRWCPGRHAAGRMRQVDAPGRHRRRSRRPESAHGPGGSRRCSPARRCRPGPGRRRSSWPGRSRTTGPAPSIVDSPGPPPSSATPSWAAATLDVLGTASPRDRAVAAALYPILDGDQLAQRAIAALTQGVSATWGPLLVACPAPWPDALGQAAMGGIAALAPPRRAGRRPVPAVPPGRGPAAGTSSPRPPRPWPSRRGPRTRNSAALPPWRTWPACWRTAAT